MPVEESVETELSNSVVASSVGRQSLNDLLNAPSQPPAKKLNKTNKKVTVYSPPSSPQDVKPAVSQVFFKNQC